MKNQSKGILFLILGVLILLLFGIDLSFAFSLGGLLFLVVVVVGIYYLAKPKR